jgi:hypothetical protein
MRNHVGPPDHIEVHGACTPGGSCKVIGAYSWHRSYEIFRRVTEKCPLNECEIRASTSCEGACVLGLLAHPVDDSLPVLQFRAKRIKLAARAERTTGADNKHLVASRSKGAGRDCDWDPSIVRRAEEDRAQWVEASRWLWPGGCDVYRNM